MNRVHQGFSGTVFPVELVEAFACYSERGYRLFPIVYRTVCEGYTGKVTTVGKQERSQKDICGLVVLD